MKTPLYFNYSGSRRDLLDRAITSYEKHAGHLLDIRVNYSVKPRKFTACLNEILRACSNEKRYFFAHYDSELESAEPIVKMLEDDSGSALISWTNITDLLMLVDVEQVNSVSGWDESFSNSYMEIDLINRLIEVEKTIKVVHPILEGEGLLHNNASTIRDKNQADNIAYVYGQTLLKDALLYYTRYGKGKDEPLYIEMTEHVKKHYT